MGGSVLDITVVGELFAGTNFDCNEPTFNYEALAQLTGTIALFGEHHDLFLAEAVYGKDNGRPLADELLLTVWDDVIYQQPIPQVDCAMHTYEIFHETPSISVDYTLWISIVPISFTANADVILDLSWGWQICDSNLGALVQLVPHVQPSANGDAEIDLYIIKAGIELIADLGGISIIPQGWIQGSECEIGFDIREETNALDVALTSYYAWQECTLFFFDCHWAQQDQYTWYSWTYPATNEVLFQEVWKIDGKQESKVPEPKVAGPILGAPQVISA